MVASSVEAASAASGNLEKLIGIEVRQQMVVVVKSNEAMRIVRPDRTNVEHQPVDGDIDPDNAAILEGLCQRHSDLRRGREAIWQRPDDGLRVLHGIAVPAAAARIKRRRRPGERSDLTVFFVEEQPGLHAGAAGVRTNFLNHEPRERGAAQLFDERFLAFGYRQEVKEIPVLVTYVSGRYLRIAFQAGQDQLPDCLLRSIRRLKRGSVAQNGGQQIGRRKECKTLLVDPADRRLKGVGGDLDGRPAGFKVIADRNGAADQQRHDQKQGEHRTEERDALLAWRGCFHCAAACHENLTARTGL